MIFLIIIIEYYKIMVNLAMVLSMFYLLNDRFSSSEIRKSFESNSNNTCEIHIYEANYNWKVTARIMSFISLDENLHVEFATKF